MQPARASFARAWCRPKAPWEPATPGGTECAKACVAGAGAGALLLAAAWTCHSCAGGNTQVPAPLLQSQTGPVPARLASCPVPGPQRLGLPRAGNWTRTLQIWELGAGLRASAVLLSRLWGRGHEMASREAPSCRWSLSSRSVAGGPREKKKHVREGGRRRWGQGVRVSRPGAKVGRSLEASHRTYRSPIYAPAGYNAINNM